MPGKFGMSLARCRGPRKAGGFRRRSRGREDWQAKGSVGGRGVESRGGREERVCHPTKHILHHNQFPRKQIGSCSRRNLLTPSPVPRLGANRHRLPAIGPARPSSQLCLRLSTLGAPAHASGTARGEAASSKPSQARTPGAPKGGAVAGAGAGRTQRRLSLGACPLGTGRIPGAGLRTGHMCRLEYSLRHVP